MSRLGDKRKKTVAKKGKLFFFFGNQLKQVELLKGVVTGYYRSERSGTM